MSLADTGRIRMSFRRFPIPGEARVGAIALGAGVARDLARPKDVTWSVPVIVVDDPFHRAGGALHSVSGGPSAVRSSRPASKRGTKRAASSESRAAGTLLAEPPHRSQTRRDPGAHAPGDPSRPLRTSKCGVASSAMNRRFKASGEPRELRRRSLPHPRGGRLP
jgi:hypothetical protein